MNICLALRGLSEYALFSRYIKLGGKSGTGRKKFDEKELGDIFDGNIVYACVKLSINVKIEQKDYTQVWFTF